MLQHSLQHTRYDKTINNYGLNMHKTNKCVLIQESLYVLGILNKNSQLILNYTWQTLQESDTDTKLYSCRPVYVTP